MAKFYSKRNHVELINGTVVKKFADELDFKREVIIYQNLHESKGIKVPVIESVDNENYVINIEYLDGPTVLEFLELLEKDVKTDQAVNVLYETIEWLEVFYKLFESDKQVMGDVNLRNFIWYHDEIYGIDFESSKSGDSYCEKAELLARYLLYDPDESEFKKEVIKQVLSKMNISDEFEDIVNNTVRSIKIRRNKNNDKKYILNEK